MIYHRSAQVSRFWLVVLAGSLILTVTALKSFQDAPGATTLSVTYSHGMVHASIPAPPSSPQDGRPVRLVVEVLDPADLVLGRTEKQVQSGSGSGAWQADIALAKPLPLDDLAWQRLHYSFTYEGARSAPSIEAVESISQILRMPVVHILGQQSYFAGGQAAVRVVVTDTSGAPVGSGSVRIELNDKALFTGALNPRGTTQAQFQLPAGLTGTFPLHYAVDTPLGGAEYTQPIRVEDKASILLTTEKPLYQPGQTIHVRALALDRLNHQASANRALTFEMEDPRGNKVFKAATRTDAFGVASAEFPLADEVNLGTYHLRARIDGNSQELTLNVARYVLPKFKVAVEFAGGDKTHGYRPGEHVTGTVRANYFFGNAVDNAEVTIQASGMDVAKFEAGSAKGKTDGEGVYHFDFALPAYFAGRPLSQGAARVLVEATVKDSAEHSETRGEPIVVSESPLIITAVPEGGALIPNLENQLFVLTSYADGKPAAATVRIHGDGIADQTAMTDEGGVAVMRLPAGAGQTVLIDASDRDGNKSSSKVTLDTRSGQDQVLLRTERAIYKTGDRIALRVLSTKKRGSVYVDVIKEGQSILTRDIDIENGQGELALTATPELAGTVELNAYQFGADARPVADHRMIFVQPADELQIETSTDRDSYKPGEDARVRFHVTNASGQGVEAALGLQVVDEAVFALAEKQPGFAEVFFYLEQEAMKPRYEIHSFGMEQVVARRRPGGRGGEEAQRVDQQRDRAAQALFAATELVSTNRFETELGRTAPQTRYAVYAAKYRTRFDAQLNRLAEDADRLFAANASREDLPAIVASLDAATRRDAWGTDLRIETFPRPNYYLVRSAGPDRRFNTPDDQIGYLQVKIGTAVNAPDKGKGELATEHDRGPFNGLAAIAGCVVDPAGSSMTGVKVEVRNTATGTAHSAVTDASCNFSLNGLAPGSYEITASSRGVRIWTGKTTLQPRDRAVASVSLTVASTSKTVVVVPAPAQAFGRGGIVAGIGGAGGGGRGGGRGGRGGPVREFKAGALAAPVAGTGPMPAFNALAVSQQAAMIATGSLQPAEPAAHVRSYFPEALYINPEIITDKDGRASIQIPLADSITTWRMAMLASTTKGALGSSTSSIKVFQDFFADLDLPVTLTQGDRVSLPVAVYDYSGSSGDARLELHPEDWFSLVSDTGTKTVPVESGRVGAAQFTIEARRIGKFKLTLSASMKGGADIVVREIEVVPNGREQTQVFNGRVESAVEHEVDFPSTAIPDASKLFVRLYPGPLSQVIEGMDAILRMPNGCFEQTSSATYPNVLALDYMKTTRKLTPEVHAKAEGFIVTGYQRLLTFEVPGGGFSWFGQAPANKILTAYGLMEFSDMSKVHDVDPKLIQRTQQWLAAQQQPDGSWKPDTNFINEGATNRFNSDTLRISAYIAWSLETTGYQGPAVERAKQFIAQNTGAKADPYTLAVLANFAVDYGKDRAFTQQAIARLLDARTEKDDMLWWDAPQTGVFSTGLSAAIETTGLAVQALLKSGENSASAAKALAYLASKKNAQGSWGTTQATIMALRALLLSSSKGSSDVRGSVELSLNGKVVEKLALTPDNNDLLHQFVFKNVEVAAANRVGLRFTGTGSLAYQVAGSYFTPWQQGPAAEPLSIVVKYDRTSLAEDDIATATATVKNNLGKAANMVMIDLGIPPGFDLLTEDLQAFEEKTASRTGGRLEKFSLTATQAILYFDSVPAGDSITLKYRLRAKYPIHARTFASRVYEYYDPDVNAVAQPVEMEIRKR